MKLFEILQLMHVHITVHGTSQSINTSFLVRTTNLLNRSKQDSIYRAPEQTLQLNARKALMIQATMAGLIANFIYNIFWILIFRELWQHILSQLY